MSAHVKTPARSGPLVVTESSKHGWGIYDSRTQRFHRVDTHPHRVGYNVTDWLKIARWLNERLAR